MSKIKQELEKQQLTGSFNELGDEDYLYEEYLKNEKLNEEYWEEQSKTNSIFPDDMFYDDEYYKSTYHPTIEEEKAAFELFNKNNSDEHTN